MLPALANDSQIDLRQYTIADFFQDMADSIYEGFHRAMNDSSGREITIIQDSNELLVDLLEESKATNELLLEMMQSDERARLDARQLSQAEAEAGKFKDVAAAVTVKDDLFSGIKAMLADMGDMGFSLGSVLLAAFIAWRAGLDEYIRDVMFVRYVRPIRALLTTIFGNLFNAVKALEEVKGVGKIVKLLKFAVGKFLFWAFAIYDGLKGFIEGASRGSSLLEQVFRGFWGAFHEVIKGIAVIPLDFLKDVASWLLKNLGFDAASVALDTFSFENLWNEFALHFRHMILRLLEFIDDILPGEQMNDAQRAELQEVQEEISQIAENRRKYALEVLNEDREENRKEQAAINKELTEDTTMKRSARKRLEIRLKKLQEKERIIEAAIEEKSRPINAERERVVGEVISNEEFARPEHVSEEEWNKMKPMEQGVELEKARNLAILQHRGFGPGGGTLQIGPAKGVSALPGQIGAGAVTNNVNYNINNYNSSQEVSQSTTMAPSVAPRPSGFNAFYPE